MGSRTKAALAEALKGLGLWGFLILEIPVILASMAQLQSLFGLGPILNFLMSFLFSFIPLVGGALAFFGSSNVWQWSPIIAFVFFIPILFYGAALLLGAEPVEK
jgi:hypothetical protein